MSVPTYPQIKVQLLGEDGNAYLIVGRVAHSMKRGKVPQSEIDEFCKEAMSGNYNHLLQTCMKWVTVDKPREEDV